MSDLSQAVDGVSLHHIRQTPLIDGNLFLDTVGSCSMLPREKQGVVSHELIVYGTKNLRIADISVIPLHFAAHSQGTMGSSLL